MSIPMGACPKCKDVGLLPLRKIDHSGRSLYCPECHGLWVAKDLLAQGEEPFPPVASPEEPHDDDRDKKAGLCPEGHGLLIRAKVDADPAFYLDRCTRCGGVWFDQGEMRLVLAAGLTDQLPNLWSLDWQRTRRRDRDRQEYLQELKATFGPDIFGRLTELIELLGDHPDKTLALAFLSRELFGKPVTRS